MHKANPNQAGLFGLLVLLILAICLLAACGNSEEATQATQEAEATQATAEAAATQATAEAEVTQATHNAQEAAAPQPIPISYTFKIAQPQAQDSLMAYYTQALAEQLKLLSGGRFAAEFYSAEQLGSEQIGLVQQGIVDIALADHHQLAALVPEANLFNLHYLMPGNGDDFAELLAINPAIELLSTCFGEYGLNILAWQSGGADIWSANQPLTNPEICRGLRMGVAANPLIMAAFEAYGFTATSLANDQLYPALQQGSLDALNSTAANFSALALSEVQSTVMQANANYTVYGLVMNRNIYQDFAAEDIMIIEQAIELANLDYQDYLAASEADFAASGLDIKQLSEAEQAQFKQLAIPIYQEYANTCGAKAAEIIALLGY